TVICYYSIISDLHSFPTRRSSDLSSRNSCSLYIMPVGLLGELIIIALVCLVITLFNCSFVILKSFSFIPSTKTGEPPANFTCSRSEEHTSELQSRFDIVCRLLLEK